MPIAFVLLAPLGLCLGLFMPLGVRAVSTMTEARREYVAWGWAVNGFSSVVGAVLATLLSMIYGFHVVLCSGSPPTCSPCSPGGAWHGGASVAAGAS